jgi:hypothetical protein
MNPATYQNAEVSVVLNVGFREQATDGSDHLLELAFRERVTDASGYHHKAEPTFLPEAGLGNMQPIKVVTYRKADVTALLELEFREEPADESGVLLGVKKPEFCQ